MSTWRGSGIAFASAGAIIYLVLMLLSGNAPTHGNRVVAEERGVLDVAPAAVTGVSLTAGQKSRTFARDTAGWRDADHGRPLTGEETEHLMAAIAFMRNAPPVRLLRPEETASFDAAAYGLDPPALSVRLAARGGSLLVANFGGRANDGIVQYMRIAGRGETFMMSGFVADAWGRVLEGR